MFKKYNDEDFLNVINSLKGLPHVSASVELESNIKRELNSIKTLALPKRVKYYRTSRTLIPAFGLSLAVFLFFILTSYNNKMDVNNPFSKLPALRDVNTNKVVTSYNNRQIRITDNDVVLEEVQPESKPVNLSNNGALNASRNISTDKRSRYLDLITSNTDENNVDKSLKARPNDKASENNAGATVNFNGFNIIQDEDQTMDVLRARMDSLKKVTKGRK